MAGRSAPIIDGARCLANFASRRSGSLILKLAVSGVLVIVVTHNIGTVAIRSRFETQTPAWLAVAALLTAAQIVLGAVRWDQILRALGAGLSIGMVLTITYISSFFASWLFGVVGGDAARAIMVPAGTNGRAAMVHSVLFDRILTLAGLGLVAAPGVAWSFGTGGHNLPLSLALAVAEVPMVGMMTIAWTAKSATGRSVGTLLAHIPAIAGSWRDLLRARGRLATALLISAFGQLVLAGVAYSLARAQQLDVSYLDFAMVMPPVVLLATLPISAGGWGVRETAMVMMLASFGVASGAALLISVEMGALAALVSLPAGVIWILRRGARPQPTANT